MPQNVRCDEKCEHERYRPSNQRGPTARRHTWVIVDASGAYIEDTDGKEYAFMRAAELTAAAHVRAQADALARALEPFARFASVFDADGPHGNLAQEDADSLYEVHFKAGEAAITLGDVRRALAALKAWKEQA